MSGRQAAIAKLYARWKADPIAFWAEAARAVDWIEPPATVFDARAGVYGRWYPDGVCNTCHNAVDRHVAAGHGERIAIIYDSPVTQIGAQAQLCRAQARDRGARRRHPRFRRRGGRPRPDLHADGARDRDRDARLRAARRGPFGGVRRLRGARACDAHRGLPARSSSLPPPAASSRLASCPTSR